MRLACLSPTPLKPVASGGASWAPLPTISLNLKNEAGCGMLMAPRRRTLTQRTGYFTVTGRSVTSPLARWVSSVADASNLKPSVALAAEPCTSTTLVNVVVGLGVSPMFGTANRSKVVRGGELIDEFRVGVRGRPIDYGEGRRVTIGDADGRFKVLDELRPRTADSNRHGALSEGQVIDSLRTARI